MDFPIFPPEFSPESKAAVIKAEIEASKFVQDSFALLGSPLSAVGHFVGTKNKRDAVFRYIMIVFAPFAHEVCRLARERIWSIDLVDRAAKEFLRQTVLHAAYRYSNSIGFPDMTSMGQIAPAMRDILEKSPEWNKYQEELLEVADLQTSQPRPAFQETPKPVSKTEKRAFPNRAEWLTDQLHERAWNKNDVRRFGGPDRRTVQRILDGFRVREDGLELLARALSKKGKKVDLGDIPSH